MGLPSIFPKWRYGAEKNIDSTEKKNGNILITVDSGKLFIDIDGKRIEISGIEYKPQAEILAIEDPSQKIYISTDTYKIYYHNGLGWVCLNLSPVNAEMKSELKGFLIARTENGSFIYDEDVYLDIQSGNLKAKTFNGYTLAKGCAKDVVDATKATALSKDSEDLVTERKVFYALPNINNTHEYTSDTNIYAPNTGGTAGYILTANSPTSAPIWTSPSDLVTKLGFGFGTCSTAAATVAKTVAISNFALVSGSLVSIRFTNSVPANATLNINNTGAKPIWQNNKAILADVIEAGVICTFVYDGTHFNLLLTDVQAGQDYYMLE
ncbi:MAG: hypothetical protein NC310_09320 [Roseburia sp.]|nr:hypothetical protein [Roseburia sp.]